MAGWSGRKGPGQRSVPILFAPPPRLIGGWWPEDRRTCQLHGVSPQGYSFLECHFPAQCTACGVALLVAPAATSHATPGLQTKHTFFAHCFSVKGTPGLRPATLTRQQLAALESGLIEVHPGEEITAYAQLCYVVRKAGKKTPHPLAGVQVNIGVVDSAREIPGPDDQ